MNLVKANLYQQILHKIEGQSREIVEATMENGNPRNIQIRNRKDDITEDVAGIALSITRDIGIKPPDQYQASRFYVVLKKYYSDFSLTEVKMAFTLSLVGALEEYLPGGDPNAYGEFSLKYITKILNAYRRKRADVMIKANKLLPEPDSIITEHEKRQNSEKFVSDLIKWFEQYKEGIEPDIFVIEYAFNYLLGCKVIPKALAPTKKEVDEIIQRKSQYLNDVKKHEKQMYKDMIKSGIMPEEISQRALITAKYNAILRGFDKLIQNNEPIQNYL